jgi:bloom syndrome protein
MASKRRQGKNQYIDDEAEEDDGAAGSDDYGLDDGFIVPDDHFSTDDDDDDFEPVREGNRRPLKTTKRALGPPIKKDARMTEANLPEIHQMMVHEFVLEAKKLDEEVRNSRGLKRAIFTEKQFREMCIRWTMTIEDLSTIEGVNESKAKQFGGRFVSLIKRFNAQYTDMMEAKGGNRDMDQNHQNVIDLLSDDDDDDEFSHASDEEDDTQGERSAFFAGANPQTQAFNRRIAEAMPQPPRASGTAAARDGSDEEPYRPAMTQTQSTRGGRAARGGGFRKAGRKASGGSSQGGGSRRSSGGGGGVRKRGAPRRTPGGATAAMAKRAPTQRSLQVERRGGGTIMSEFVRRDGGGGVWKPGGGGGGKVAGIGMMPTK